MLANYDLPIHVDSIRVSEYYRNLKLYYPDITYHCVEANGKTNFDLNIIDKYDIVFIYHEATFERLMLEYNINEIVKKLQNKKSYIQLDCAIWPFTHSFEIMKCFNAVGIAHERSIELISHNSKFYIQNACVERQVILNNPNGNIVYIGRIKKINNKLKYFAETTKQKIILYTFDSDMAKKYSIHELIDFKGTINYEQIPRILNNASFGLCFYDNESPCGKVFDYLSCGLPVVCEQEIGEADMIRNEKLGMLFNINELSSINFKANFNSNDIYNNIKKKHLWEHRIKNWVNIIKKHN